MRRTQGPRPDRRRIELAVNRLAANLAQLRDVPKQRALELDEDMRTLRDQMQRADNLVGDIETLTSENEVFRERIKAALQWQPDNSHTASIEPRCQERNNRHLHEQPEVKVDERLTEQHRAELLELCGRQETEVLRLQTYIRELELRIPH